MHLEALEVSVVWEELGALEVLEELEVLVAPVDYFRVRSLEVQYQAFM